MGVRSPRPTGQGQTDCKSDGPEMGLPLSSLRSDELEISRVRSPLLETMRNDAVLPFPPHVFRKWLEATAAVAAGRDWFIRLRLYREEACHVLQVRSASWILPCVNHGYEACAMACDIWPSS